MQKPYASKCEQGKIKIDLFRDFLQKLPTSKLLILFQLKFPPCINGEWFIWDEREEKLKKNLLKKERNKEDEPARKGIKNR
jgi:hypothetical protein